MHGIICSTEAGYEKWTSLYRTRLWGTVVSRPYEYKCVSNGVGIRPDARWLGWPYRTTTADGYVSVLSPVEP
jgi:hypothetical protein